MVRLAGHSELAKFKWTVNELKAHVARVAGHCRTKRAALDAMNHNS